MKYKILIHDENQTGDESSFIGGLPALPIDFQIPRCKLCSSEQTFFFQLEFPAGHVWSGVSLAVFSCTSCADENSLIPAMLACQLSGADIPLGFLDSYQTNFRFLVFRRDSAQLVERYKERIAFKRIQLEAGDSHSEVGQVGGTPTWILGNEFPNSYNSQTPMEFLLQLKSGLKFPILSSAKPQIELDISGRPQPSPEPFYQLFLGNELYLFGSVGLSTPLVYAITQVR
jgi:hypothetical protein